MVGHFYKPHLKRPQSKDPPESATEYSLADAKVDSRG
jgi:hypothetical protein